MRMKVERAHILRLFLDPNDRRASLGIRSECEFQKIAPQRIKLFEANDRDVFTFGFGAISVQFVINFPGAEQDAAELASPAPVDVSGSMR